MSNNLSPEKKKRRFSDLFILVAMFYMFCSFNYITIMFFDFHVAILWYSFIEFVLFSFPIQIITSN